jgi:nucleotide-binding universal stress UspA family protein
MILDFARDNGVDLIVMATHGRQGLSHLMLGSVAESVIRQASIPTLVVPYQDPNG